MRGSKGRLRERHMFTASTWWHCRSFVLQKGILVRAGRNVRCDSGRANDQGMSPMLWQVSHILPKHVGVVKMLGEENEIEQMIISDLGVYCENLPFKPSYLSSDYVMSNSRLHHHLFVLIMICTNSGTPFSIVYIRQ